VLDVGAGGCTLEPLVNAEYVGVDISTELLARGALRAVAVADRLPFADGSFDTVVCISVLQYVLDVEGSLLEFRRLVGVGGQIVILVPNVAYLLHRLNLLRGRMMWASKLDSWRSGTIRQFTLHDLAPLFARLDLRVRDARCSGRFRELRSRRPELLGADLLFDLEVQPSS
jgi:ubiquinone/menaquinone biosynthesis C-methylase UbiE